MAHINYVYICMNKFLPHQKSKIGVLKAVSSFLISEVLGGDVGIYSLVYNFWEN